MVLKFVKLIKRFKTLSLKPLCFVINSFSFKKNFENNSCHFDKPKFKEKNEEKKKNVQILSIVKVHSV
jgi:hypothetical protein